MSDCPPGCRVNFNVLDKKAFAYLGSFDHWTSRPTVDEVRDLLVGNGPWKRAWLSSSDRRTIDSKIPYSLAISLLLLTASASITIFNLKLRSLEWRRVFGMIVLNVDFARWCSPDEVNLRYWFCWSNC